MASSAVDIDIGTRLAIDRTRLAYERTLMAWIRTAVSMITFGFTIYKFFEFELKDRPMPSGSMLGPHEFAVGHDHDRARRVAAVDCPAPAEHACAAHRVRRTLPASVAAIVAGLFSILGLLALATVMLRW